MYPRVLEIPLPIEFMGSNTLTIYSFGAMMAIAFLVAAWLMQRELDRLFKEGRIGPVPSSGFPNEGEQRLIPDSMR